MKVREIKAAVRERDGQRCTECGLTAEEHIARLGSTLEVHRLVPGSPYTIEGCVTLCRSCHGPKPKSPRGTRPKGAVSLRWEGGFYQRIISTATKLGLSGAGLLRMVIKENLAQYERPPRR